MGIQLSSPKKGGRAPPPIFSPSLLWPNGWMHQHATWYGGRPHPRRLCVRWGPSSLPQKGRSPTQFSVHVYCGQTAAWIMMPLGTEVGLSLRDIVLDGVLATPRKKGTPIPPNFWFMSIVVKRVDEDATWYGSSRRPRPHCIRRGPSCPRKGTAAPPPFLPMSFVATVAHVSYC